MKSITFYIKESLLKEFKKYCIDEDLTMTEFLLNKIKEVSEDDNKK